MKIKLVFFILLINQMLIAQDTIPFVLTDANNIAIQSILNETDTLNLMFHTAANDVALTETATVRLKSLNASGTDTVKSWGGESTARYSKGNDLRIGKFKQENLTIWEDKRSGVGTDGKFGLNFFEGKIIEMDFDNSILILHDVLPTVAEKYEKHKLIINHGLMFLEIASKIEKETYTNQFLIHSGYGGTILYDDGFSNEHKFGERLTTISESELRDSYGNVIKTKKAILPELIIGAIEFKDIPVGFFEGTIGRQRMSVMGGNLIKRFNIIFDLQNADIYLKENTLMALPFSNSLIRSQIPERLYNNLELLIAYLNKNYEYVISLPPKK